MGKAQILSHLGDGQYSIIYFKDVAISEARKKELEKQINDLQIKAYGSQSDSIDNLLQDANLTYLTKSQEFLDALDAWANCAKTVPPCPDISSLKSLVKTLANERAQLGVKVAEYEMLMASIKTAILAAQAELAHLSNTAEPQEVRTAWCVDYPPDGVPHSVMAIVGTAETYGAKRHPEGGVYLPSPHVNILPHYGNQAGYNIDRDHRIMPISSQSVATAINNIALFLHAMTNNPDYAVGVLSNKDETGNTGTVTLYGKTPVSNQPAFWPFIPGQFSVVLNGVPIVYQTCGARAFENGDEVVVKFAGLHRASPTVIGFAEMPKECKEFTLTYTCATGGFISGDTNQVVMKGRDGTPVEVVITDPNAGFKWWSDDNGNKNPYRQDIDVQQNIAAQAILEYGITWPATIDIYILQTYGATITYSSGYSWISDFQGTDAVEPGCTYSPNPVTQVFPAGAPSCGPNGPIWAPQTDYLQPPYDYSSIIYDNPGCTNCEGFSIGIRGSGIGAGFALDTVTIDMDHCIYDGRVNGTKIGPSLGYSNTWAWADIKLFTVGHPGLNVCEDNKIWYTVGYLTGAMYTSMPCWYQTFHAAGQLTIGKYEYADIYASWIPTSIWLTHTPTGAKRKYTKSSFANAPLYTYAKA